jgi:hypothetical protein
MITCPQCQCFTVTVTNGNFAHAKVEGEPAFRQSYNRKLFYCENCEYKWQSTAEAERDYNEYVALRGRTEMLVRKMGVDGSYGPPVHIDGGDLILRDELAKKIIGLYRHLLDLAPDEWFEIEQDAR